MSNRALLVIGVILCAFLATGVYMAISTRNQPSPPERVWSPQDRRDYAENLEQLFLNEMKMDTHVWASGEFAQVLNIEYVLMGRVMANELSKNKDFINNARRVGFSHIRFMDHYEFDTVYKL